MNNNRTIMGILIAVLGFYFWFFVLVYLGGVVIAIGAYFIITGFRTPSHRQISGKVNQVIYDSLLERGSERIKTGQIKTTQERFVEVLDKLQDILGSQGDMPELGYDAIYFHCKSENEAASRLSQIADKGLKGSLTQNKSDWQIKVEF
ncbi:MAG: hypothetical protein QXN26_07040 [Thermoplasmataceae archaeon]